MEGETPLKDNCMIISEKFEDGLATFPPATVMVPSPCEGESTRARIHALWNGIYTHQPYFVTVNFGPKPGIYLS